MRLVKYLLVLILTNGCTNISNKIGTPINQKEAEKEISLHIDKIVYYKYINKRSNINVGQYDIYVRHENVSSKNILINNAAEGDFFISKDGVKKYFHIDGTAPYMPSIDRSFFKLVKVNDGLRTTYERFIAMIDVYKLEEFIVTWEYESLINFTQASSEYTSKGIIEAPKIPIDGYVWRGKKSVIAIPLYTTSSNQKEV